MLQRRYKVAVIGKRQHEAVPESMPEKADSLSFRKITLADIPAISRILHDSTSSRTCDYTVGGIFMWIRYFDYQFCILNDTLFIRGDLENHPGVKAFSLPIGKMKIPEAIALLRKYCAENNIPLRFSAIPEDRLQDFRSVGLSDTEELDDWADYLYDAESLASLSGKKMSKKRNHYNRFVSDNPGFSIADIRDTDTSLIKDACKSWITPEDTAEPSAAEELEQTFNVLDNLSRYPFEGIVLRDGAGTIIGFTVGEVIGDTLYVHIEKINRDVAGVGESINKLFAERICTAYPAVRYINREEDTGDDGLRKAKESYHPIIMLRKYNIKL